MGQVAFDTQEFVETLEKEGLPKNQAKAISLIVRKSHEVVDLATKRDLEDVRKDLSTEISMVKRDISDVRKEIADVRKDLSAEIANVRKDLSTEMNLRFEKVDAQISDVRKDMAVRFEKTDGQIALIRKDVETIATGLLLKLGGVIVLTISAATAILKFF